MICNADFQVDEKQFSKILDYIKKGEEQGADLVAGGARLGSKGYYIQPTVFGGVSDNNVIFKEEIFGPVQVGSMFMYFNPICMSLMLSETICYCQLQNGQYLQDLMTRFSLVKSFSQSLCLMTKAVPKISAHEFVLWISL